MPTSLRRSLSVLGVDMPAGAIAGEQPLAAGTAARAHVRMRSQMFYEQRRERLRHGCGVPFAERQVRAVGVMITSGDCPINGVWVRPVFISEWFFRTDRRR
jgi:hypothetical protein